MRADLLERRKRSAAHHHRQPRRNQQSDQRNRRGIPQARQNLIPQQRNRNADAHFAERFAAHRKRIPHFVDRLRPVKRLHLLEDIAALQLREKRSRRDGFSRHLWIARRQHHPVLVYDHHVIHPGVCAERRLQLFAESFVSLERLSHVIAPVFRRVGCRLHAALLGIGKRPPRLRKHLLRQLIRSIVRFLNYLAGQPGKIHAGKNHYDEEDKSRHHQRKFCAQPQLHRGFLLPVGVCAAVFLQFVVQRLQTDA